jgi:hypothetical protein
VRAHWCGRKKAHRHIRGVQTRVATKTLFRPFAETKTFTKGVTVFEKFRQFFAKPQSDKKWYKISVEKEYIEPDPWFFGLLDPDPSLSDPVQILLKVKKC